MHKHNIIQYIKLVNIKDFILPKKMPCMLEFPLVMCNAYHMLLLTMKFFQVNEMCATPCCICVFDIVVNIETVKS